MDSALATTAVGEAQQSADAQTSHSAWISPAFDFDVAPSLSTRTHAPPLKRPRRGRNFFRSAQWCMDASAALTTGEDQVARIYTTQALRESSNHEITPSISVSLPSPAISSAWFPSASVKTPATFCFATGIRDAPVRLIDGTTGQVRATYPIVDHRERYVAPWSMAWNPSSTKLYCGHENAIEVLDVASPGHGNGDRIKTSRTKGDKGGQKGIVSALAFAKDYSGLYAAGTYGASNGPEAGSPGAGSVSLYDEDVSGAVGHLGGVVGGGVTQIAFHPISPSHLFVASRRSSVIQAYDSRNPSAAFSTFDRNPLTDNSYRPDTTNQRMVFDIDPWGRYLAAGDVNGSVRVWSIGQDWAAPFWEGTVAEDAVASVQFSSVSPELLIAVGSRDGPSVRSTVSTSRSDGSDSMDEGSESDTDSDDDSDVGSGTGGQTQSPMTVRQGGDGYLQMVSFSSLIS